MPRLKKCRAVCHLPQITDFFVGGDCWFCDGKTDWRGAAGIRLYGGVPSLADQAVEALLAGKLSFNPAVRCNHHDHAHGSRHSCGEHGCGGEH